MLHHRALKSYLLKLNGREEGPYSEAQVAQMYADHRVNRSTSCKPELGGDWRTIDDYLPTLKYGTQLPSPTPTRAAVPLSVSSTATGVADRVAIVDVDVPFPSILKMAFKIFAAWLIVVCCFIPVFFLFWAIIMALFAGVIGGLMSGMHHP